MHKYRIGMDGFKDMALLFAKAISMMNSRPDKSREGER